VPVLMLGERIKVTPLVWRPISGGRESVWRMGYRVHLSPALRAERAGDKFEERGRQNDLLMISLALHSTRERERVSQMVFLLVRHQ